jgi:3-methyladenine DNA glycosylase AlkD
MARFGINPENTFGVSIPNLRRMAKEIGKDHSLAQRLWFSGIHEARILASMIDDPNQVTGKQMDSWIKDFNSWDVCDQCCMNLFSKISMAWEKAIEWTKHEEEFEKRAGFVLMVCLAWYDKKFLVFLPRIKQRANDDRNYVKKAVNWR